MPLEGWLEEQRTESAILAEQRKLYEYAGVVENPFPSANQTTGHPHSATPADERVDREVIEFYNDRKSHVLAITATQGIGKTNLLNAYEAALRSKLTMHGFFVIRYVADPERFFDRLIVSIIEYLGESYLKNTVVRLTAASEGDRSKGLSSIREPEFRQMVTRLGAPRSPNGNDAQDPYTLAYQWLLGQPVRKPHRDALGVYNRLDTVEAKTRALRDIVALGVSVDTLQGIFLLIDELEKGDVNSSKTELLRYLQAMRALIDAFPTHLFLMAALTPDALDRYREMQPAIRGRLANEIRLLPLRTPEDAVELYSFYLEHGRVSAEDICNQRRWHRGANDLIAEDTARDLFEKLNSRRTTARPVEGVRQRDYLNALHELAATKISVLRA
jgi:hypothetical protein